MSSSLENPIWSTILAETGTSTCTPIRRNFSKEVNPSLGSKGCQTLYEALRRGLSLNPNGACLGFRATSANGEATPFIYSSYVEIVSRVDSFGAGLQAEGLCDVNDQGLLLLGIHMKNCPEWVIAEHGIFTLGGITVPFYDTLGPDTVSFILSQTNLSAVVCSRAELRTLCAAKATNLCPKFRAVILVDGVTPDAVQQCHDAGIDICTSFGHIETKGALLRTSTQNMDESKRPQYSPPAGHDIATFCYTSGTTGDPKGALITHTNLLSSMEGLEEFFTPRSTDRHLSYLPLPHIFERLVLGQMLKIGASISFFRGDPTKLIEDIQACRPTIMPVAPRVLNKIHDKVQAGMHAAGGLKLALFKRGLAVKREGLKRGILTHGFYDALLFNKLKRALGMDAIRFVVSGSAPLSENVMTFFRCMLGICIVEGYGQTEGSAAATLSHTDDIGSVGHVGGPVGGVEIVLADVPEMGYLKTDTIHDGAPCHGRGEIWVRGPNVFKGYYMDEAKTRETVDEDGWLHSGDIGLWTEAGAIKIIDRKKNIFKLAQGEYVAAEKIENILSQSLLIGQIFVYGDSYQSSLVAIIVVDEEVVTTWATKNNHLSNDIKVLCEGYQLHDKIMKDIKKIAKENSLQGFETPKAIYLESSLFTPENGLVTPTFKLKRQQLRNLYQKQIDDMYTNMPPPPSKL